MDYYVKEMSDKRAILMAVDGYELATFSTIEEAITACQQGCLRNPLFVETSCSGLQCGTVDIDSGYMHVLH